MKLLHLGDIHLGSYLDNFSRNDELRNVFDFLVTTVKEQGIEAALLCGDIFDNGSPANESQELYYSLLIRLQLAGCKQVVVIAGNHDSPTFLAAPKSLLKVMDIHVITAVDQNNLDQEIIALGEASRPDAIVCAAPFLRERDIRKLSPPAESASERAAAIAQGIVEHYRQLFSLADARRGGRSIPLIAMGHLYAIGSQFASDADEEGQHHAVGTLDAVNISSFPPFDYIALGHIHKPQAIAQHPHWRYAGSLLPMNIREKADPPQVTILDTLRPDAPETLLIPDECFHKMQVVKGNMEELRQQLRELQLTRQPIWIKPVFTDTAPRPNWFIELKQEFIDDQLALLFPEVRLLPTDHPVPETPQLKAGLAELTPFDVFTDYLQHSGCFPDAAQRQQLTDLYLSAQAAILAPSDSQEKSAPPTPSGYLKFKKLTCKNINSLYGEHTIDFTHPAFNSGIFLISGPTGAGKTSILDAICLALYGTTPRIDNSSLAIKETTNPLCSEGASDIFAELTFDIVNGEQTAEYRARFEQQKTGRRDANKPFRKPERALYLHNNKLNTTNSECNHLVEDLVGLNLEQFTRCVLLAQGSFDAFIKAKDNERAPILTAITGTSVYGKIGAQINARYNDVHQQLVDINKQLQDLVLLSPDDLQTHQQQLGALQQQLATLNTDISGAELLEQTFVDLEKTETLLQHATADLQNARQQLELAAPQKLELAHALQAARCQEAFTQLRQHQRKLQENQQLLDTLSQTLRSQQDAVTTAEQQQQGSQKQLETTQQYVQTQTVLLNEARKLEAQISEKDHSRTASRNEINKLNLARQQADALLQRATAVWNQAQDASRHAQDYLASHPDDHQLTTYRQTWNLQREHLVATETQLQDEQRLLKQLRADQKRAEAEAQKLHSSRDKTAQKLEQLRLTQTETEQQRRQLLNGRTYEQLLADKEAAIRMVEYAKHVASLEEQRQSLQDGAPCPLCGATAHPYCHGATPLQAASEQAVQQLQGILDRLAQLESQLKTSAKDEAALTTKLAELQERCHSAQQQRERLERDVKDKTQAVDSLNHNVQTQAQRLSGEILGHLQVAWHDHRKLPPQLEQRIEQFASAQTTLTQLDAARETFTLASQTHQAQTEQLKQQLDDKQRQLGDIDDALQALRQERNAKTAEPDLDAAEKQLRRQLLQAQDAQQQAVTQLSLARNNLQTTTENLSLNSLAREQSLLPELAQAADTFQRLLHENQLQDENDYLAKFRPPQQLQELQQTWQLLEQTLTQTQTTVSERQERLDELRAKLPHDISREQNQAHLQQLRLDRENAQTQLADLKHILETDRENRQKSALQTQRQQELRESDNLWKLLDDHFGNKAGDKFSRIAQGYTFRALVKLANDHRPAALKRHFTLMSSTDVNTPLELNVIDHYRGDAIRTSRNLSGGETFEISLALALGLAEMSAISQKARLGNVLLDEGFGTLDDKALDSAIELLMQLRNGETSGHQQKLVGIISHVSKLKERIDTQITVTNSAGYGVIAGPGVTHRAQNSAPRPKTRAPRAK